MIDAMEALSFDPEHVSAVADAVGSSMAATLDVLTAMDVPIMKVTALKRALSSTAKDASTGAAATVRLFVVVRDPAR